jgi:TonB family protein
LVVAWILACAEAALTAADDSLTAARDLYAQASYDEALGMLNRLRSPDGQPAEQRTIERYRALCLLALGRAADARRAIEVVVAAEPSFHPSETEVSPRVRLAFRDVRRRMLPEIAKQKYVSAKTAFDRKEFREAAQGFGQVLEMLDDPDLSADGAETPLPDLRVLAQGFRDLSVAAAAPSPPAPVVQPQPPSKEPANPPPSPVPAAPRVYSLDDRNVVPPSVLDQTLPTFAARSTASRRATIALVVNESGAVESAVMLEPFGSSYDRVVLQAARQWRYSPARLDGVPVKYRRLVQINLEPAK